MSFLLSEGLNYHIDRELPIRESVYRPGSQMFFQFISEAKHYYRQGLFEVDEYDHDLLMSDIGEYGLWEGNVVPLDYPIPVELDTLNESDEFVPNLNDAKYKGREVKLNKPTRGGSKKFQVYVKNPKTGNVKRIQFGAPGMSVGLKDPKRRKSFAARHRCSEKKDKTKAGYWACRIGRYPHLFGGKTKYTWW
jgi:hypothetical protein